MDDFGYFLRSMVQLAITYSGSTPSGDMTTCGPAGAAAPNVIVVPSDGAIVKRMARAPEAGSRRQGAHSVTAAMIAKTVAASQGAFDDTVLRLPRTCGAGVART